MAFAGGNLSVGSISIIANNQDESLCPILQVARARVTGNQAEGIPKRIRYSLSDSQYLISALPQSGDSTCIPQFSIIKLTKYTLMPYRAKGDPSVCQTVVIIVGYEVLSVPHPSGLIGQPLDFNFNQQASSGNGDSQSQSSVKKMNNSKNGLKTTPSGQQIVPVVNIDPFLVKWVIRVRVGSKSDIKSWDKPTGKGQLFSMTLIDDTGEIKATCFGSAVDRFYPLFEERNIYLIHKCNVVVSRKQYTSVKHQYELHLDVNTIVEPQSDDESIPSSHYEFVPIDKIQDCKPGDLIDVVGVVSDYSEIKNVRTKRGDVQSINLIIIDDTNRSINLKVWGDENSTGFYDILTKLKTPILGIKGVKVSDFGGRTLSSLQSTNFTVNPNLPESERIYNWFTNLAQSEIENIPSLSGIGANSANRSSITSFTINPEQQKTISQITTDNIGLTSTPDYIYLKNITLTSFPHKQDKFPWYLACGNEECKGKKVDISGQIATCPKCGNKVGHRYKWLLSCAGYDSTGKDFFMILGDIGNDILGITADATQTLLENQDRTAYENIFEEARFKSYNLKVSVKTDTFENMEGKKRCTIMSAIQVDFVREARADLEKLSLQVNMDLNLTAFSISSIAGMSSGLGGILVVLIGKSSRNYLGNLLSFSAGIMIYISFMDLMPEAIEKIGFIKSNIAFFLGIIFFGFVSLLISHVDNSIFENSGKGKLKDDAISNPKYKNDDDARSKLEFKVLKRAGLITALGISLHNFPEGIAVYLASLRSIKAGLPIVIAIGMHNIPEGMAVASPIYYSTNSKWKAIIYALLSGLFEPLGVIIFVTFFNSFINENLIHHLLAGAAGIMTLVSIKELIPISLRYVNVNSFLISNVVGMFLISLTIYLLHDHQ